nr:hypothetical protein [Tanacetum cinerariifolium]
MHVQEQNVDMEVKSSRLTSLGDVTFEQLMDEYDQKQGGAQEMHESPYDTESEIEVVMRSFSIALDVADYDVINSVDDFDATDTNTDANVIFENKENLSNSKEASVVRSS